MIKREKKKGMMVLEVIKMQTRQKEEPVTEICSTITESFSFLSTAMFFALHLVKDSLFFADIRIWM